MVAIRRTDAAPHLVETGPAFQRAAANAVVSGRCTIVVADVAVHVGIQMYAGLGNSNVRARGGNSVQFPASITSSIMRALAPSSMVWASSQHIRLARARFANERIENGAMLAGEDFLNDSLAALDLDSFQMPLERDRFGLEQIAPSGAIRSRNTTCESTPSAVAPQSDAAVPATNKPGQPGMPSLRASMRASREMKLVKEWRRRKRQLRIAFKDGAGCRAPAADRPRMTHLARFADPPTLATRTRACADAA